MRGRIERYLSQEDTKLLLIQCCPISQSISPKIEAWGVLCESEVWYIFNLSFAIRKSKDHTCGKWKYSVLYVNSLWHHDMETFSMLLAICAGNSPVPSEFPSQRPVTRSFDVFFDLRPNKRLSKQWWGWWFEMPSSPLWCHCNVKSNWRGENKNKTHGQQGLVQPPWSIPWLLMTCWCKKQGISRPHTGLFMPGILWVLHCKG